MILWLFCVTSLHTLTYWIYRWRAVVICIYFLNPSFIVTEHLPICEACFIHRPSCSIGKLTGEVFINWTFFIWFNTDVNTTSICMALKRSTSWPLQQCSGSFVWVNSLSGPCWIIVECTRTVVTDQAGCRPLPVPFVLFICHPSTAHSFNFQLIMAPNETKPTQCIRRDTWSSAPHFWKPIENHIVPAKISKPMSDIQVNGSASCYDTKKGELGTILSQ